MEKIVTSVGGTYCRLCFLYTSPDQKRQRCPDRGEEFDMSRVWVWGGEGLLQGGIARSFGPAAREDGQLTSLSCRLRRKNPLSHYNLPYSEIHARLFVRTLVPKNEASLDRFV